MARSWTQVDADLGRIVAESDPPLSVETIAHAQEFLKYLRERTVVPTVGRGYDPTLAIWWDYDAGSEPATTTQFEVYAHSIEVRIFRGMLVEAIEYVRHVAGEPYPPEIEGALLPHRLNP